MKRWLSFAAALLLFPAVVSAGDLSKLPVEVRTAQGVKYYNGGVGIDERARLPQHFPLKVILVTSRGLYLNDADVQVLDKSGREVLRVQADNGPWLVANLPPGTYRVEATLEGKKSAPRSVTLKEGGRQTAFLRWKDSEVDMGL